MIGSTIACGNCSYCRAGFYSQCNNANPNGPEAGTAFFGGPAETGPFDGLQAEYARIPFANIGMVKLPDDVTDEQAILISDIFPTAWFGAEMANVEPGRSVAVFGCGPVGQFVIASAKLMDAGRIFAVDCIPSRLEMARDQGAEIVDFSKEDPVETIKGFTGGIGVDRVIDAVGVDAVSANQGGATNVVKDYAKKAKPELRKVAPVTGESGDNWHPGDSPSQALEWEVEAIAKAGTLAIIGVYPQTLDTFPIGSAMNKNLRLNMGNCNHRKYIPKLVNMVRSGVIDPAEVLTQSEPLTAAIDAYKEFDRRMPGWIKVKLEPAKAA